MLRTLKPQSGFSLIELMVTLIVLMVLIALAVPSFNNQSNSTKVSTTMHSFVSYYQLARNTAISQRVDTIYCPMDTKQSHFIGNKCGQDWEVGAVIFKDRDGNLTIDTESDIVGIANPPAAGVQMRMRAGLNKQYLRFLANGYLENTAGSVVFCAADNEPRHAKTVIFTRNGRLRFGTDKNKDGIQENAEGQPIGCPP